MLNYFLLANDRSGIMANRPSVDEYYLEIAKKISERSTCLRIHYGAVLVKNNRIISTGYNGAAAGFINCDSIGCIRKMLNIPHGQHYELCRSVHAEENAIMQAHPDEREGSTLYLYGIDVDTGKPLDYNSPCDMCKRKIRNAKIISVISVNHGEIIKIDPKEWISEDMKKYNDLMKQYLKDKK